MASPGDADEAQSKQLRTKGIAMKLSTIWTLPGLPLRERFKRTGEAMVRGLAHRLPRRLAYWSFIDTGVRHIRSDEVVPEVAYMDLLERAGKGVER